MVPVEPNSGRISQPMSQHRILAWVDCRVCRIKAPNRCPVTPEYESLRHLLYGHKPHVYRVIYRILEKHKNVEVLHVRLGAIDEFATEDLVRRN